MHKEKSQPAAVKDRLHPAEDHSSPESAASPMMTVFCEDLTTSTLCRRVTPQLCTQVPMPTVNGEPRAKDRSLQKCTCRRLRAQSK